MLLAGLGAGNAVWDENFGFHIVPSPEASLSLRMTLSNSMGTEG